MFYSLFTHFINTFPGARLFTYISFRAITAGVLALCISIWFGKWFIRWMKRHQFYETQRDEKIDPAGKEKKDVPTMGGLIVIAAILVPCLLLGKLSNIYMILLLVTTLLMGAIGFLDDYIKTFRKNKDGLNGWLKIAGQVTLGLIVGLTLRFSPAVTMNEVVSSQKHGRRGRIWKATPFTTISAPLWMMCGEGIPNARLFSKGIMKSITR